LDKNKVLDIVERRISNQMGVELIDASDQHPFVIKTFNHAEQLVAPDTYTEWIFYITPLRAGKYPLILKVYIVELVNDEKLRRELVFRELVEVVTAQIAEKPARKPMKSAGVSLVLADRGGSSAREGKVLTTSLPPAMSTPPPAPPQNTTSSSNTGSAPNKASNSNIMKIIGTAAAFLMLFGLMRPYMFNQSGTKTPDSVVINEPTKPIDLPPLLDTLKNTPLSNGKIDIAASETPKAVPQKPQKEVFAKSKKNKPTPKKTNDDIALVPAKKTEDASIASTDKEIKTVEQPTARVKFDNPSPVVVVPSESEEVSAKNVTKDTLTTKIKIDTFKIKPQQKRKIIPRNDHNRKKGYW
jgi:hypothetical protein